MGPPRSLEGVREEKAALVRAILEDGAVALNADDLRVAGMARDTRARVITYGLAGSAAVRLSGSCLSSRSNPGTV